MSSTTDRVRRLGPAQRASLPVSLLRLLLWLIALVAAILLVSSACAWWVEDLEPHQAAPQTGRWLRAHDVEMYVQEFGDPKAPTLILAHGTGAWSGTWDLNTQAMTRAGYRVIAIDLPPFGFSTQPASHDYSRAAQARRIAGLVDTLARGPAVLLGHSYGGGPAAEAAMTYPDRFKHLILVDAAIGLKTLPAEKIPRSVADTLMSIRNLRSAFIATVGTQPLFSEFWLRQFVARKEVVTPARTAIYQQPFVVKGFSAALGDWAAQFGSEDGTFISERPEGFRELTVPLTLMWGELDTITPPAQAEALAKLVPRSKLVMLPGVGHIPQIEDASLFNARLSEVLGSLVR
jgi:pimeloyl-ACP methyl ester carboxylesterase